MSMFKQLDDRTLVSGQIAAADLEEARRLGVTVVVNNRPDGEDPDQPPAAEIEAACRQSGLGYHHVPIARGIGPADVKAMRDAMHEAGDGKMLAFCRSGTRSTLAWAIARREDGADPAELTRAAESAGFSLAAVQHLL
jgi:uncharacterized protein (TIGR01244 family)